MPKSTSPKKVAAIFSLPVEVKEKLFATVPDGARSRFVAEVLAAKLGLELPLAAKKAGKKALTTGKRAKVASKKATAPAAPKAAAPKVTPPVAQSSAKAGGFFSKLFQ